MKKLFWSIIIGACSIACSCADDMPEGLDSPVKAVVTDSIPSDVLTYYHETWSYIRENGCDTLDYKEKFEPTVDEARDWLKYATYRYADTCQDLLLFSDNDYKVAFWIGYYWEWDFELKEYFLTLKQ